MIDGLDLFTQRQELIDQLNELIDESLEAGLELAKKEKIYKRLAWETSLKKVVEGMKITFISQFLVGEENVSEAREKRDIAEVKYKNLQEKINSTKLQLRLNEAQTQREWSRYSDY